MIVARQITVLCRPAGELAVVLTGNTSSVESLVISLRLGRDFVGQAQQFDLGGPFEILALLDLDHDFGRLPLLGRRRLKVECQERFARLPAWPFAKPP